MDTTVKRPADPQGSRGGRVRTILSEHRRLVAVVAVAMVGLGIFAFLWLRPDKLFVDATVNEAPPAVPGAAAAQTVIASGSFRDLEHPTSGNAKILKFADGSRIVRLEGFRTSNGPDVVVILSSTPATEEDWRAYDDGAFVNLGSLKGNVGSQNYEIPASVDLGTYRSVVIWCRRFNVAFGAAPIS